MRVGEIHLIYNSENNFTLRTVIFNNLYLCLYPLIWHTNIVMTMTGIQIAGSLIISSALSFSIISGFYKVGKKVLHF